MVIASSCSHGVAPAHTTSGDPLFQQTTGTGRKRGIIAAILHTMRRGTRHLAASAALAIGGGATLLPGNAAAKAIALVGTGIVTQSGYAVSDGWIANPANAPFIRSTSAADTAADLGTSSFGNILNAAPYYNSAVTTGGIDRTTLGGFIGNAVVPPDLPASNYDGLLVTNGSLSASSPVASVDAYIQSFFQFQGQLSLAPAPNPPDYLFRINHDDGFDFRLFYMPDLIANGGIDALATNPVLYDTLNVLRFSPINDDGAFGPGACALEGNAFNPSCEQTIPFNVQDAGDYVYVLSYGATLTAPSRIAATVIPEPASLLVMTFGLFGLISAISIVRRQRQACDG